MPSGVLRAEISDIQALRLVCNSCGSAVSMPVSNRNERPPERCPVCGIEWSSLVESMRRLPTPPQQLMMALRALKTAQEQEAMIAVQIEFDTKETTL